MKPLERIYVNEMPDSIQVPDGWNMKSVPEPTKENMEMLVNKINELIDRVNDLTRENQ